VHCFEFIVLSSQFVYFPKFLFDRLFCVGLSRN